MHFPPSPNSFSATKSSPTSAPPHASRPSQPTSLSPPLPALPLSLIPSYFPSSLTSLPYLLRYQHCIHHPLSSSSIFFTSHRSFALFFVCCSCSSSLYLLLFASLLSRTHTTRPFMPLYPLACFFMFFSLLRSTNDTSVSLAYPPRLFLSLPLSPDYCTPPHSFFSATSLATPTRIGLR